MSCRAMPCVPARNRAMLDCADAESRLKQNFRRSPCHVVRFVRLSCVCRARARHVVEGDHGDNFGDLRYNWMAGHLLVGHEHPVRLGHAGTALWQWYVVVCVGNGVVSCAISHVSYHGCVTAQVGLRMVALCLLHMPLARSHKIVPLTPCQHSSRHSLHARRLSPLHDGRARLMTGMRLGGRVKLSESCACGHVSK